VRDKATREREGERVRDIEQLRERVRERKKEGWEFGMLGWVVLLC